MLACHAAQCDGKKLCDVPLTDDMRDLLGLAPDYCTLLRECKVQLFEQDLVPVVCQQRTICMSSHVSGLLVTAV